MASLFGPPIGQSHDEFRADSGSNSNPIVPSCLRATIVSEIDWPCPVPLPTPFVVKKGSKTLGGSSLAIPDAVIFGPTSKFDLSKSSRPWPQDWALLPICTRTDVSHGLMGTPFKQPAASQFR